MQLFLMSVIALVVTGVQAQTAVMNKNIFGVEACEGKTVDLSCPMGHEIMIQTAFWGRSNNALCPTRGEGLNNRCNLSSQRAKELVMSFCEGRRMCRIQANTVVFGDPCTQATDKYLLVDYACEQTVYQSLVCEGGQLPLACPGNRLIETQDVFFGRDNFNDTCSHASIAHSFCASDSAMDIVQELCDGKNQCEINSAAEIFGDPCPGSYKYLRMNYTCVECQNAFGNDAECERWALQGLCTSETDSEWMYANCAKACWKCDDTVKCYNAHPSDDDCDFWADNGDCETNLAWMQAYCKKSCTQCDKPTGCGRNLWDEFYQVDECDTYYVEGACRNNPGWGLSQCTKSCFGCETEGVLRCENRYFDRECEDFALRGECGANPGWMYPNCLKACLGCNKDPVCANEMPDSVCDAWFSDGECENNPTYMYKYCWKSCVQCAGPPACANAHQSLDECEFWAATGECNTNSAWMMDNCRLSCTRCKPVPVANCINDLLNDTQCDDWARGGECHNNAAWMLDNCRKSCTKCRGFERPQLLQVGENAAPGMVNNMTMARTFILPDTVPVRSTLTHFSAFFVSTNPVWMQIWSWDATNQVWQNIYRKRVQPTGTKRAETILVEQCVYLLAGDYIGFTAVDGVAPIAYTHQPDNIFRPTFVRRASETSNFERLGLPFKFSFSIGYDPEMTGCTSGSS